MFIAQINTKKFNFLRYLPFSLTFFGMLTYNYFATVDVNTDIIIKEMISKFGLNLTFAIMVMPLSTACLMLFFWVKYIHNQSITSLTTSRKTIDWKRFFFGFSLWASISITITLIDFWINPEDYIVNFKLIPFLKFLLIALILLPLQTSFEEYFMRGYLMQGIGVVTKSRLIPFLFTSTVFGLMHAANPEVDKMGNIILLYYIGTGFFLDIIALMDNGIELTLGFHAANNIVTALLVTTDWSVFQTNAILKSVAEPSASIDILLPILVLYPILLIIFAKKYNWNNWKSNLTGKLQPNDNQ